MDDTGLIISGVALIPLLTGLGQLFKNLGVESKWIPLLNTILGVGFSVGWTAVNPPSLPVDWFAACILGLMMGLSSSGLYSTQKTLRE